MQSDEENSSVQDPNLLSYALRLSALPDEGKGSSASTQLLKSCFLGIIVFTFIKLSTSLIRCGRLH